MNTRQAAQRGAWSFVILIAALAGATAMAGCKRETPLRIGDKAPEISALDLNDDVVRLSSFRGKVVVLR